MNNPFTGARRTSVLALLAVLAGPSALVAQAPPPDGGWVSFRTEHFRVTFTPELEALARRAAGVAERTHAVLREELAGAPEGLIELLVTDHVDVTNGYATPFPSNRIVVFARPPLDIPALASARDWVELVVAHELVHIFHLDVAGSVGLAIRNLFGRVPMFWPLFPAVGTPGWNVEGLATHYESRLTGAGRVHGSFHDMVVRVAALESGIPDLDAVSTPSPVWPGGQRSYVYGASFMRWLAEEYGPEVHSRLVSATAGARLPTFLFFDGVAEEVTGLEFDDLYAEWRSAARDRATIIRDRLIAGGLTVPEPVSGARPGSGDAAGPFAVAPRVSPHGSRVAYTADDHRSRPTTRVLDLATGEIEALAERNQAGILLGPASWLPDGSGLITAQLEFQGPYRVHSDLWRIGLDGGETRVTRGARLTQPDVAADGRRVVAVQNHDGALRLVIYDLERGDTEVLAAAAPGEGFTGPRWSPDGRLVAAGRFRGGRMDLVLVDIGSGAIVQLTDDDALDLAPAWTPDGSQVLFWSDRTGIANLYAAEPATGGAVRQVTSVLGGAFDPDVSPDGRWIYFSGYHASGWRIERIPMDSATWRAAPPSSLAYREGVLEAPDGSPDRTAFVATSSIVDYSPWPSVRPHFWFPTYQTASAEPDHLHFLGLYTTGWDLLRRHVWEAALAFDVGSGRVLGDATWTWRGLGVPEISLSLHRAWSRGGSIDVPGGDGEREGIWLHEEGASLEALFRRQRWGVASWLTAGAEVRGRGLELHRGGSEGDAILDDLGIPPTPTLIGARAGVGWRNARAYPYSISLQDGASVSLAARRWWDLDDFAPSYDQVQGRVATYACFPAWGFADHVLAARVSGLARFGDGALPTTIGGLGGGALFLPVRGYDDGDRIGTRAWTASAEYRFPLHLAGWSGDILGLSVTSLSGALFADAGDAWCEETGERQGGGSGGGRAEEPFPGCRIGPGDLLLSAGAEISLDFGVLHEVPLRLRGGLAIPFTNVMPDDDRTASHPRNWRLHLVIGPSF